MSKKREITYHIIFWIAFLALDQLMEIIVKGRDNEFFWSVLQGFGFTLLQMMVFYVNYLWICPRSIPSKKWVLFGLGQLGLLFLFPLLRYVVEEIIIYRITGNHNYNLEGLTVFFYVFDNSYFVLRLILLSLVAYFLKRLWTTTAQVNKLQLEKKQAELQVLKNQLSPHFLFNTLNSFYSDLYDTQPKVADDIMKLSEMLRYVTYENEKDTVSLKDESQFLQHYIDLFKRRFDGNVAIVYQYPEDLKNYRIPSLLLIHFVENAFKHGILDDANCPVVFTMEIKDNRLLFSASNYFRKNQHYDVSGIGQKNITQRLAIMFPEDHSLKVEQLENKYNVVLNIPLL